MGAMKDSTLQETALHPGLISSHPQLAGRLSWELTNTECSHPTMLCSDTICWADPDLLLTLPATIPGAAL